MNTITTDQCIYLLITYLVAAIPFGVIVSRLVTKKDVRTHGSGNIGATNVARMMGKKWGVFVLFLDALKGYLVVYGSLRFNDSIFINLVAVLAVFAHCYPIYLKFKGGKGVATAVGVLAAISPIALGLCLVIFIVTVGVTRIISVGSLLGGLSLVVFTMLQPSQTQLSCVAATLLCGLIWWKHKENIKRLIKRQEPKFF